MCPAEERSRFLQTARRTKRWEGPRTLESDWEHYGGCGTIPADCPRVKRYCHPLLADPHLTDQLTHFRMDGRFVPLIPPRLIGSAVDNLCSLFATIANQAASGAPKPPIKKRAVSTFPRLPAP
jgi:hypothetical protein